MVSIVKQTFAERYTMYLSTDKDKLANYLITRDKYSSGIVPSNYIFSTKQYQEMNVSDLSKLLAIRDIYEAPAGCAELEFKPDSLVTVTSSN